MKNIIIVFTFLFLIFIIPVTLTSNKPNEYILGDTNTIIGDIDNNNKVTAQDYIIIRKYLLKSIVLDNNQQDKADVNRDGSINSIDYILIRKIILNYFEVEKITLNKTNIQMDAGSTFQLEVNIEPIYVNTKVSYSSSNNSVATISDSGLITAKHDGNTTITVKTIDGKKTIDAIVSVKNGNPLLFGWDQKEADKKFGPILDGIFTGKTKEVFISNGIGGSFGMHFPDMIYKDGVIYAYYITYNTSSGKGGIGLATSTDGVKFENKGCVIEPSKDYDLNGAYFAGVWVDNGTYYIVYEAKGDAKSSYGTLENVALAASSDGIHWDKKGIIIYRNPKINWLKTNVGTPDLYKVGDTWYVTFHGYDSIDCQIGIAYGKDLTNLTVKNEPIIPTVDNTPYSGTTGRRDIIYIDGWYYMVYEVSTDATPNDGYNNSKWSHQFARSKDMINWTTISSPLLVQKNADGSDKLGFGYDGPCWVIIDDHLYVYFRDNGPTSRAELVLK